VRALHGGGADGDRAPAAPAAKAEVGHPAPARFGHRNRRGAAIIVGFVPCGGDSGDDNRSIHGGCSW